MKIGSRVQEILRKVSGGYFYPPKATIKLAKPSATMRVKYVFGIQLRLPDDVPMCNTLTLNDPASDIKLRGNQRVYVIGVF